MHKHRHLIYLAAALIIALAILFHGVLNYISMTEALKLQKEKLDADNSTRVNSYYKQSDIDKCIASTKAEFDRLSDLNSVEVTMPNGVKAHKWNSSQIKSDIEDQYNKDREFCLKLYK